tara:strand:- start:701 stop:1339 length:639 start_codon:yes stop_codon:yes gene_type:complete
MFKKKSIFIIFSFLFIALPTTVSAQFNISGLWKSSEKNKKLVPIVDIGYLSFKNKNNLKVFKNEKKCFLNFFLPVEGHLEGRFVKDNKIKKDKGFEFLMPNIESCAFEISIKNEWSQNTTLQYFIYNPKKPKDVLALALNKFEEFSYFINNISNRNFKTINGPKILAGKITPIPIDLYPSDLGIFENDINDYVIDVKLYTVYFDDGSKMILR